MSQKKRDITGMIARRGGVLVNLVWLGTLGAAAPQIWPFLNGPDWMRVLGLLAVAAPALIGFVLMPRMDRPFERFALAIVWTGFASVVAILGGGITGIGVLAFLLAPAVAAAGGERDGVVKGAALSGFAAVTIAILQAGGFIQPAPMAVEIYLPFVTGCALMMAAGFGLGALRAMREGDRVREEAERGRVRVRAFDAAPVALLACDQDGNMLAASQGLRELSPGLPRDLTGLPVADLGFDDDDRADLASAARRAAIRPLSQGLTLRGDRGREEDVRLNARPMHGGSVAILSHDAGPALENRVREAEAARELAEEESRAKSQFLASVSHELRTPLNAIVGFSDVMKARLFGPLPARYAEYADLIHESGQHLMELIGDVLDMSKIEADRYELVLERFDIDEAVGLAVKMMRLQAEESGITLSVKRNDTPVPVKGDRKALRQILLNLLSNAVKFTPKGGAIVVMARPSGGQLVLAVGDSGVGIDPEDARRLGQPYSQASNARDIEKRGTGLGLSLVRALAELHGGQMNIASSKGVGTTVTVSLPILDKGETQVEPLAGGETVSAELDVRGQIERAQAASENISKAQSGAA